MTQHATNGLTTLTQSKTNIGASMVKDTCLRTGFDPGSQSPGPRGSRTQHLLLTHIKHGPQNKIIIVHQIVENKL